MAGQTSSDGNFWGHTGTLNTTGQSNLLTPAHSILSCNLGPARSDNISLLLMLVYIASSFMLNFHSYIIIMFHSQRPQQPYTTCHGYTAGTWKSYLHQTTRFVTQSLSFHSINNSINKLKLPYHALYNKHKLLARPKHAPSINDIHSDAAERTLLEAGHAHLVCRLIYWKACVVVKV